MRLLIFATAVVVNAQILTQADLIFIRQSVAASGIAIDFSKAQANSASQNLANWIASNRGALPNVITTAGLTAGQRTAAASAMGGSFSPSQRSEFLRVVGAKFEITVQPPPDVAVDPKAAVAVKTELMKIISASLDAVLPGMSDIDKIRALKLLLDNPQ
jgi:hypothetical protein